MSNTVQTYRELDLITDAAERARVAHLSSRMVEIAGASRRMVMMELVAEQEGLPAKTVERMYYAWRRNGALALADKRKIKVAETVNEILPVFKTYCEADRNTSRGGWRTMMRDFRLGRVFDFGTWRDIWARENPHEAAPAECPYAWIPRGWGYANLMRLMQRDPDRLMKLAWSRQGQFAASKYTLPVIRSREGLAVGAVYQADDVWHNIDVFAPGQDGTFQPLEFAFYDVASAYKLGSFIKPRLASYDEKTGKVKHGNLNEFQFRTAFAYVCCCIGFHPDGVRFILERGTTAIRENVRRRIRSIPHYGNLIAIETGGVMNTPAHKGLFTGNAGGNPRFKALCESSHNILHNASAGLPGNRGRDAAHMHESQGALVRAAERTIARANAIDAELLEVLQLGVMSWDRFAAAFREIEAEVMERTDHHLEGWTGNEIVEYRDATSPTGWRPIAALREMDEASRAIVAASIRANPAELLRKRRMSRAEVWRGSVANLVKVPLVEVPQFLDPRDAREGRVGADGVISFRDQVYYPGREMRYTSVYRDRAGIPHRLCPGDVVRFYWAPWGELRTMIWVVDESDSLMGICSELQAASWTDPHSIRVAAGQKIHAIAEARRDMEGRHAYEAAEKMANEFWNKAVLATAGTGRAKASRRAAIGGADCPQSAVAGADCPQSATRQTADAVSFLEQMNQLNG